MPAPKKSGIQTRRAALEVLYDAYNRRDVPTLVAALDPQVEWTDLLNGQPLKGPDAVGAYWTDQFRLVLTEVTPLGFDELPDGRLAVTVARTMKTPEGGDWGNDRVTHVFAFGPDGLILRMDPT